MNIKKSTNPSDYYFAIGMAKDYCYVDEKPYPVLVVTHQKHWEKHHSMSDWHVKIPILTENNIYQIQESIFQFDISVDDLSKKMLVWGFKQNPEFTVFVSKSYI